jgi:hypothetical protein
MFQVLVILHQAEATTQNMGLGNEASHLIIEAKYLQSFTYFGTASSSHR